MDEVDGMAGNEDRGGIAGTDQSPIYFCELIYAPHFTLISWYNDCKLELIQIIKSSKIPIICLCNDRQHQKIRSLAGHCFDLRFQKPRVEQITGGMISQIGILLLLSLSFQQ